MTTYNTTIAPTQASDAEFRVLVAAIRDSIDQILTRTADTGQINTTTVTRGVAGTSAGYNMWRITGGTQDVFMKVEYGSTGTLTNQRLWFTFGTTTDGAGTVGGAVATRRAWDLTSSVTAYNCFFSSGTGRFAFVLYDNHPTVASRVMVSCERDWDSAGAANEAYYFAIYTTDDAGNNKKINRFMKVSGDQWREFTALPGTWPSETATHVLGLDIAAYPVRGTYGPERNPSFNWIVVGTTDVAAGTIFSADLYGASRTWVRTNFAPSAGQAKDGNHALCMRWE